MCSYPSSVATFTWTENTQSCIKFGSKPSVDQRSKRFKPGGLNHTKILKMMKRELVRFEFLFSLHWYWIVECIIKLMIRAECLSVGHAIGYFWKSLIDNYYTELYSTTGSSEEWFFVRAVILNTKSKLGKSVNSFHSLSINQQEVPRNHVLMEMIVGYCLRSFYKFPKILFRDLSNLFTSAWNSNQMLSHNDVLARYKLNSVMVPLETAFLAILVIVLLNDFL